MTDNEQEKPQIPHMQAPSDPMEVATNMFAIYKPRFELFVKGLSTGELRRLVNALVQYPLNDKEFITNENPKLKEAYRLGNELIRARTMLELCVAQEEEMKKLEQEENKETVNEELRTSAE